MTAHDKPKVLLTSPVFYEIAHHEKVSKPKKQQIQELWEKLNKIANVMVLNNRFPSSLEIYESVKKNQTNHILCHLSHPISQETLNIPSVRSVSTSTAGYNHIAQNSKVLLTHTPSVLDKTVADFTLAVTLGVLRNLIDLHNGVWEGNWSPNQKWDLDENLNNTMDNLTVGIVGLGEIGKEVVQRIAPWGIKMVYYGLNQNKDFESDFPTLSYSPKLDEIFATADVVSLHVPLNAHTHGLVGEKLLKLMKPNSLLVNTSRGPVVDFPVLIRLLANKEISINLAFDVYDPEPISQEHLSAFQQIKAEQPDLRFIFIPHNASSDADTRAQMAIIVFEDLITLIQSTGLQSLQSIRLIPPLRYLVDGSDKALKEIGSFRIAESW